MGESILDFLKNKDKNPKFLTDWSLWGENSSWRLADNPNKLNASDLFLFPHFLNDRLWQMTLFVITERLQM